MRTFITPIKVRVTLRQGQYTGIMNKWICTIHGEKREVTMRDVEWYCMNVEDAVHSFKESEIESFTIVGQYPVETTPITVLEEQAEQLRKHDVVGQSEQCEHEPLHSATETVDYCPKCGLYQPSK